MWCTPKSHLSIQNVAFLQDFENLIKVYKNVDDIDFYAGMLMEKPKPGSLVGQTIRCILADQFFRLKNGDRFFYENGGLPSSFSAGEMKRFVTLGKSQLSFS